MAVLGVDLGTTGVKAVVLGNDGTILGRAYGEYRLVTDAPGWAELDPVEVLRATTKVIRAATATSGEPPSAVGLSAAGEAFVPVDASLQPLGAVIVSFDRRAIPIHDRVVADIGAERFEASSGLRPLPHYSMFKWLWWKEQRPQVYARTAHFVSLGGMIAGLLGGRPAIDESFAVRSLLYDAVRHDWAWDLVADVGLKPELLPPVLAPRTSCGTVSAGVARSLGIAPGANIVVGAMDQLCAAFGIGLAAPDGMLSIGTMAVVGFVHADKATFPRFLPSVPHVVPEKWLALGGSAGGSALRWFRDAIHAAPIGQARPTTGTFDEIVHSIQDRATAVLFLPHLGGSRVAFDDPSATGAFVGLTFDTGREDLARAVIDGVAYEIAILLGRLGGASIRPRRLMAVGGASTSRAWLQIIADATRIRLDSAASGDVAAVGAARLAHGDVDPSGGGAGEIPPVSSVFSVAPRDEWRPYHAERLEQFRAVHHALRAARPQVPL
jgi:xylulokinase